MVIKKNKRGWIKIVEAFLAILLLITIVLLAVNTKYLNINKEETFYNLENKIFQRIQINKTLRNNILSSEIPINSSNPSFSNLLINELEYSTPLGINCNMAICPTNFSCDTEEGINKSIYVKEILIVGNSTVYSPRIVKLACY
ncbi:MAG: hypothetical protein U9Q99_01905 [Nanoarchaeota archaeon]|nr:hypothetical protein [Nanoarchaeota archaeon]